MFNLQGSELIIILLLALVVLGPEKLPDAMRKAGQFYAELKKMSTGFQSEFKAVVEEPLNELRDTANTLRDSADFTKLQAGEREEKPKSAEMVAAPDPDAVPTDEVPFTPAAAGVVADASGTGPDPAHDGIVESDPGPDPAHDGIVESDPVVTAPEPFSASQQSSASAPAGGGHRDGGGDVIDATSSAAANDELAAQPEPPPPTAPQPFPSSDQWGVAVSSQVDRVAGAPTDPVSPGGEVADEPRQSEPPDTAPAERDARGDQAGERSE